MGLVRQCHPSTFLHVWMDFLHPDKLLHVHVWPVDACNREFGSVQNLTNSGHLKKYIYMFVVISERRTC